MAVRCACDSGSSEGRSFLRGAAGPGPSPSSVRLRPTSAIANEVCAASRGVCGSMYARARASCDAITGRKNGRLSCANECSGWHGAGAEGVKKCVSLDQTRKLPQLATAQ